jgi:integrase
LKWSPATIRISYSGIKHFFTYTIKRDWPIFSQFKLETSQSLPVVLSVDEVRTILAAFPEGQNRTFFETVYSLGLRLTEARTLQVRDIDSDRMLVHVHAGKGAKDRLVPLPETTLKSLRAYWKTHRNPTWLFPALGHDGKGGPTAERPASEGAVQGALRRVCQKLGFKKHVRTHTFRHSYATHLIEAGVPVRHVQEYLGHDTLTSTMIYLHLTTAGREESRSRINQLMRGVSS